MEELRILFLVNSAHWDTSTYFSAILSVIFWRKQLRDEYGGPGLSFATDGRGARRNRVFH